MFDRRTPGQLRAALALTEEARVNLEARVARMEPMWQAGHAYCASYESEDGEARFLHCALLAVHRATTPWTTPPTHVVIAVDELERLKAIERDYLTAQQVAKPSDSAWESDAMRSDGVS